MKKTELEMLLDKEGFSLNVFNYKKNKKPNQFRIIRSFFYHHGLTETDLEKNISKALTKNNIQFDVLDRGEHFHPFVGGAKSGSNQDSFWFVILEIKENKE